MNLSGKIFYNDKDYPFVIDNQIVKLIGRPFEYFEDFRNVQEAETIYGITSENRYIVFMHCKFNSNFWGYVDSITTCGYAISSSNMGNQCNFNFKKCSFTSDAINVFYSPQKAIEHYTDFNDGNGQMKIKIQPFSENTKSFNYGDAECQISISRGVNLKKELTAIGKVTSVFSMIYKSSQSIIRIIDNYCAIFDFLSFLNYSTSISFNDIYLSRKDDDGQYEKIADVHFFRKDTEYKNNGLSSVTIDDIPENKLEALFSKVVSLRKSDGRLRYYFSKSNYISECIDPGKWLIAAINFEGLFTSTFPNYKSNNKISFCNVKRRILEEFDKNSVNVFSKEEKKYYNDFKKLIINYEGILEEKFNYLVKKNLSALSTVLQYNETKLNINSSDNYGKLYADYRNKIAHGSVEPLSNKEVAIYRLLIPMIYLLLLHSIDLTQDELKIIVDKLFR